MPDITAAVTPVAPPKADPAKADAKPVDAKLDAKPAEVVTKADPPAEPIAKTAEPSGPKWFECRASFAVEPMNILAKDANAAEARFKKALGVRSFHPGMDHTISITELPQSFVPSDKDNERHELIDKSI